MATPATEPTAAGTDPGPADDAALLGRFLADRSEEAFAALVAAHGPMVLGVCRRVLGNAADAEDAFQATFLVLAKDAPRIAGRGPGVGPWLYGTASRVALFARRSAARRLAREARHARPMHTTPDPNEDLTRREAERLIDAELGRLPGRLRDPLVLCYLTGLTRDQAADQLGVHPRTLERRLRSGLDALRGRLGRRGALVSGAVLVALLSQTRAAAAVPPALATAAARGAVGYAAGGTAAAPAAVVGLAEGGAGRLPLAAWVCGLAACGLVAAGVGWWQGGGPAVPVAAAVVVAPTEPVNPVVPPPEPVPVPVPVPAPGPVVVPGTTGGQMRPVEVSGRLLDPAGRPLAGVTVVLLNRPMRRLADGTVEPVPDAASTVTTRRGKFRLMGRAVTAADGRFVLRGARAIPDPATGARLLQMYPLAVGRPDARFADVLTDFDAVQMLAGDGG